MITIQPHAQPARIAAALLALVLSVTGCVTLRNPGRTYREAVARGRCFDAIIVPGIPFDGAAWSNTMKARVLWSYILYRKGIAKNVIYSGGAVYSPYVEARIMGLYACKLGIPPERIFYDTLAEHSTENVFYSYELARRLGFKSIALATGYNQAILLKGFVRKRFLTRIGILPIYEELLEEYSHLDPVIDPSPARKEDFRSITERESFLERFRGTIGKRIPWKNGGKRRAEPL